MPRKSSRPFRRPYRRSKAVAYGDIVTLVNMTLQLAKDELCTREVIINSVFKAINKGRKARKPKPKAPLAPPIHGEDTWIGGSPQARQAAALKEARRLFGIRAKVEDDWGMCRVGEIITGEFCVHGQGPTWQDAFDDAKRNGKA